MVGGHFRVRKLDINEHYGVELPAYGSADLGDKGFISTFGVEIGNRLEASYGGRPWYKFTVPRLSSNPQGEWEDEEREHPVWVGGG